MAAVLYRGPFREPRESEESEQWVPPWTPSPVLLAGVGERAPGIHLSSGDKSFNGAAVTVRLRMRKLQLSISAQGSDQNKHAQMLNYKLVPQRGTIRSPSNEFVEDKIQRFNISSRRKRNSVQLHLQVSCGGVGPVFTPVYSAVYLYTPGKWMLKMLILKGAKSEIMENVSTLKYFFKDTYFCNVEINNTQTERRLHWSQNITKLPFSSSSFFLFWCYNPAPLLLSARHTCHPFIFLVDKLES